MVVEGEGMTMLPWDKERSAKVALRNGWHIDKDDFWTRRKRKDEPEITDCVVGLTGKRWHYVRTAAYANAYDRANPCPKT